MDIQSSTLNEIFKLYPVIIQGWVTPVRPAGIADGGIPKHLYDGQPQGLECLVDPWVELQMLGAIMAVDDRVDLYLNDDPFAVTGKTVAPGEENQRLRLYVPHGELRNGVNRIYFKVTRASGGSNTSRDLRVLYNLRSPGEPAPDSMDLLIPDDVVRDGVSRERAAQGVTFDFLYNNRRAYDRIRLMIHDEVFHGEVLDPSIPVTETLFAEHFLSVGDHRAAQAWFRVSDQLGNFNVSPIKTLDIHMARITLEPPILREIATENNDDPSLIDLLKLEGRPLLALVHIPEKFWQPGDQIRLTFTATLNGSPASDHEVTLPITQVPGQLLLDIPNHKVIADSSVVVVYEQLRAGACIATSSPANATVSSEVAFSAQENFDSSPLFAFSPFIPHGLPSGITLMSLGGTMFLTQSHLLPDQNHTDLLGRVTLNILGRVRFTFPGLATSVSFLIDSHQLAEPGAVVFLSATEREIGRADLPCTELFEFKHVRFTAKPGERIKSFEVTNTNDMFLDEITVS